MLRRLIITSITISILITFIGFINLHEVTAADLKTYTDDEYGYLIKYPEDWTLQEGSVVLFIGPVQNDSTVTVNIMVERLSSSFTLEEYLSYGVDQLESLYSDFNLESTTDTKINNEDCLIAVYTFSSEGTDIKIKQAILIKNDLAYVITCGSKPGNFDENDKDYFEPMIQSFRLTGVTDKKAEEYSRYHLVYLHKIGIMKITSSSSKSNFFI